jgi:hypothetical protein
MERSSIVQTPIELLLSENRYSFIAQSDKSFICAFDGAMNKLGYDCAGIIGQGYCWGRYMIIYAKTGVKSRQVLARIYIRDQSIVLRLFLNKIDALSGSWLVVSWCRP